MHRFLSLSISLAILLGGCSNSQFGGSVGTAPSKKKEPDSATKPAKEENQPLGNSEGDPEGDPADTPVMVAGAFLTCIQDVALPTTDPSLTGFGCTAKGPSGDQLSLGAYDSVVWSILDPFNTDVGGVFAPSVASAPYSTTSSVKLALIDIYTVKLVVKKGAASRALYSNIQAVGGTSTTAPQPTSGKKAPNVVEFGKEKDFQLGDDNYSSSSNRGCNVALQSHELFGSSLSFTITVKSAKAKVGVSLGSMCGVSRGVNYVQVKSDTAEQFNQEIPQASTAFAVPGLDLEAGTYTVNIVSPYGGYPDRDDFVVGDIRFTSDGEIEVGEPTANLVQ